MIHRYVPAHGPANGTTLLHQAVQNDRPAFVRLLLLAGADANAVDGYGGTPLSLAVTEGNGPIIVNNVPNIADRLKLVDGIVVQLANYSGKVD